MTTHIWQPLDPFDAVIFDCDGTLSAIEGIDELARMNGVGPDVEALTAEAMGSAGMTIQLYQRRLDIVRPTEEQLNALGQCYYLQRSPDAETVISLLTKLGKSIYILSAGLYPAVQSFASQLGIPAENVLAVDVDFDPEGQYVDFDHASPLVNSSGKQGLVLNIKKSHTAIAHIGDGLNDLAVSDLVTRFIGYGGAFYRENIKHQCAFYLSTASLLPLLPLLLTHAEVKKLSEKDREQYHAGLEGLLASSSR